MKRILTILAAVVATAALSTAAYGQNALAEGDALFDDGKYDEAKVKYTLWKAASNERLDYADSRIAACDECMRLCPVADYLFSREQYVEAKEIYNKILEMNPKDPTARVRANVVPLATNGATNGATNDTGKEEGVMVGGAIWASRNVGDKGRFVAKPEDLGNFYTFDEAQTACPAGWRTPTNAEHKNLYKAGGTWTAENGVNGRRFGRGQGTIFLPAAGYRRPNGSEKGNSTLGYYWSGTTNGSDGRYMDFNNGSVDPSNHNVHTYGFSVRCVKK